MRQDIYKRIISGEATESRPPYGLTTTMVKIKAWVRFELNKILHFSNISERNFNSVMRRSLVVVLRAIFVPDPAKIDPSQGIYLADPDLEYFLPTAPAAAGLLDAIIGFAKENDKAKCLAIIEDYAL